ncbi:sel1 repeat family protein [Coxiella burnetii]|uniref:Tetratricopeptide repeat family protein n=1 Tax=Coxiella burnetii (strain Dugway 5J108-111) TaxID=434922 RepID=A9KDW2_COXBN|nr:sel1 repeat family protein [Coxiella burnetii]ABS76662.1 hypothetical protein CBUD_0794 [Coxiella burnetii Dugway 5J108-111]OYK80457.1 sel1 repeat family protein [Coxiella burnetii]OYK82415.1 sel1 repeat family protein [Coxiella burnetii]
MALGDPQRRSFKFFLEELFDGNYLHCREYWRLRHLAGADSSCADLIAHRRGAAKTVIENLSPKDASLTPEEKKALGNAYTFLVAVDVCDYAGWEPISNPFSNPFTQSYSLNRIDLCEKAIALGNANAMFIRAVLYLRDDEGLEDYTKWYVIKRKDERKAFKLLDKAIEFENVPAMCERAYMYRSGQAGQRDYAAAIELLEKAIELQVPVPCLNAPSCMILVKELQKMRKLPLRYWKRQGSWKISMLWRGSLKYIVEN